MFRINIMVLILLDIARVDRVIHVLNAYMHTCNTSTDTHALGTTVLLYVSDSDNMHVTTCSIPKCYSSRQLERYAYGQY